MIGLKKYYLLICLYRLCIRFKFPVADSYYCLGLVYYTLGYNEDAIEEYTQA
ncbi:unnamed protein product, partial [marine sediment metagenome]